MSHSPTNQKPDGDTVVVTRHRALIFHLVEAGIVSSGVPVLEHAGPDDVRGKHVVGVLPLRLAALAASVTEVPLDLAPHHRGRELGLDEVRAIAGEPVTYRVFPEGAFRSATETVAQWSELQAGFQTDPMSADHVAFAFEKEDAK